MQMWRKWMMVAVYSAVLGMGILAGCSRTSPVAGTWSGEVQIKPQSKNDPLATLGMLMGRQLKGPCTLTLKPDGTGFLKVSMTPERPIVWTVEDNKVLLNSRDGEAPGTTNSTKTTAQQSGPMQTSIVGTLAPDQQSMTLDMGIIEVPLKKSTS
jgi:hypothetical protein